MRRPSGYFKSQNSSIALPSYLLKVRHRFVRLATISPSVVDIAFFGFPKPGVIEKTPLKWVLQTGLRTDNQHTR
jgi:hypothetical protein